MSVPLKIQVRELGARELGDALKLYLDRTRLAKPEALRKQMRLLLQKVIQFTPPKTLSQGIGAVERDVHHAVRPVKPEMFTSPDIQELIKARDYEGLQVVFSRMKAKEFRDAVVARFFPALHRDARDRRGRVVRPTGLVTPDHRKVSGYIRRGPRKMVGQAKGGWAAAFSKVGGKPPGWIARHSSAGWYTEHFDSDGDGQLRATNKSAWASWGDEDRVVGRAMRARARDIIANLTKDIHHHAARDLKK